MDIVSLIQKKETLSWSAALEGVWRLSTPAMLAQITWIAMEYIDAAMVGSMGAAASASIGMSAPLLWLFFGLCNAAVQGFAVQVSQYIGAANVIKSRDTFRQGLITVTGFSIILGAIGTGLSFFLPGWLGAESQVASNAHDYLFVYSACIPVIVLRLLGTAMLQSSGNMKLPSILSSVMCLLDVGFNAICIFPSGEREILGISLWLPGLGWGVKGAAAGTVLAEMTVAMILLPIAFTRIHYLRQKTGMAWRVTKECVSNALKISLPMGVESGALTGAQVGMMVLVAPLGTVAMAANSLAITAEAFCYMPGYGMSAAAATLIGQSIGASKPAFAKRFAWVAIGTGMSLMGLLAVAMYILAPSVFSFLTPDADVQREGVRVLRMVMFVEPFFAAAIVSGGALRGARDTLVSSIINLFSMWGVRMTIAFFAVDYYGLVGVWMAMCIELFVRGVLFLCRVYSQKWKGKLTPQAD